MKRALMVLLVAFGSLTALSAQQAAPPIDVKGAWDMSLETPMGSMPITLSFTKQEADQITGVLSSPQGDLAITGKVTGADISFSGMFDANGQSIALSFTGKIDGDVMSGAADFGGMGQATWSAKRK
jgi:hypothetical protein